MAEVKSIKPAMRASDVVKAMLALNAAGNRAILRPDGSLVSEPIAEQSDSAVTAALIDWRRPG